MRAARGAAIIRDEVNSNAAIFVGLVIPRSPKRVGREKRSLSLSLTHSFPVMAGMRWRRMASSRGSRRSEIPGMV